jgi:hypothetical protein
MAMNKTMETCKNLLFWAALFLLLLFFFCVFLCVGFAFSVCVEWLILSHYAGESRIENAFLL